jgi:hypothetical protein
MALSVVPRDLMFIRAFFGKTAPGTAGGSFGYHVIPIYHAKGNAFGTAFVSRNCCTINVTGQFLGVF